jgi:hypothetical protein
LVSDGQKVLPIADAIILRFISASPLLKSLNRHAILDLDLEFLLFERGWFLETLLFGSAVETAGALLKILFERESFEGLSGIGRLAGRRVGLAGGIEGILWYGFVDCKGVHLRTNYCNAISAIYCDYCSPHPQIIKATIFAYRLSQAKNGQILLLILIPNP